MLESGIFSVPGVFADVEWGDLTLAPPFVTFEDRLNIYVDDVLVELHHLGPAAHTTNDVVGWIPSHRVLFSGDVIFKGGTPFVLMGSVSGSLRALDRVMAFEPDVIVPGHGEPCGLEAVAIVGEYLRFVQETAAHSRAAGLTPLEAARKADLGQFGALTDSERLAGNLHRAYKELEGAAPGAPIDTVAAFADMLALNGGQPLRCYA
jgi:cyclase